MIDLIRKFSPLYIREKWRDLNARVADLEVAVDTLLVDPYTPGQDVGFNGQVGRKRIFCDLVSAMKFEAIIETGTWIGNTTGFMAETTGLPIHTVESNRRFYSIAKRRLRGFRCIRCAFNDSCIFLEELAKSDLSRKHTFFYLDAHWYGKPPIAREIDIIGQHWNDFVIMIDDFNVPGDDGYGYDKFLGYGEGHALTLDLIDEVIRKHRLAAFFPTIPSTEETGRKRGSVVLASPGNIGKTAALKTLHRL